MSFRRVITLILILMVVISMAAAIGVLWNQTLFNRPVFIVISVFVSAWLSILIGRRWKSLSGINTSVINIIIGALIICVSREWAFMTTNFIFADC